MKTADNVDGKQARRTKSGSPLGELFDHGVDSLVMGLVGIVMIVAVNGPLQLVCQYSWYALNFQGMVGMLASMLPFWLTHWEEYHAGMLIMGQFTGPTEMQHAYAAILVCGILLLPLTDSQTFHVCGKCLLADSTFRYRL